MGYQKPPDEAAAAERMTISKTEVLTFRGSSQAS